MMPLALRPPLLAAGLAATVLAGCSPAFPPLADGPSDLMVKARVAERYPPGSPAVRLRADLAAQGFAIVDDPARRLSSAIVAPPNLPCLSHVRVDWQEDRRGRIARIQVARLVCA